MNMLRRSVGRAVRSRIVPYVALYAVLLALHLQFTLGTGDDPMYAAMLDQYSLAYFSLWHYYTWSARTLIEAVVCIVEALPAIVWRLADPLYITLCAACIVRLARLEDRPAGRWAVCGLALCYPWQDMSSAGWVCTTLVFVWPLLAALAALLPLGKSLRGNRPRARWCSARCRRNGCRGGCSVVRQPCARWRNVSRSSGHRAVFGGRNDRFLMLKIFKPGRFTARLF